MSAASRYLRCRSLSDAAARSSVCMCFVAAESPSPFALALQYATASTSVCAHGQCCIGTLYVMQCIIRGMVSRMLHVMQYFA